MNKVLGKTRLIEKIPCVPNKLFINLESTSSLD